MSSCFIGSNGITEATAGRASECLMVASENIAQSETAFFVKNTVRMSHTIGSRSRVFCTEKRNCAFVFMRNADANPPITRIARTYGHTVITALDTMIVRFPTIV